MSRRPWGDAEPVAPDGEKPDPRVRRRLDAMLDEAGRESFPASDPPALLVDGPLTEDEEDKN